MRIAPSSAPDVVRADRQGHRKRWIPAAGRETL